MKSVFFFLLLFIGCTMSAQDGWMYTKSKEGKEAHKECVAMRVEANMVVFHVSGSTYEVFDLIGKDLNGQSLWQSRATGKTAHRVVQANGTIVFWKADNKAFYYKP